MCSRLYICHFDRSIVPKADFAAEYVTVALRHGNIWYIDSLPGPQRRSLKISLSLLRIGDWKAVIYMDMPDNNRHPNNLNIV